MELELYKAVRSFANFSSKILEKYLNSNQCDFQVVLRDRVESILQNLFVLFDCLKYLFIFCGSTNFVNICGINVLGIQIKEKL